MSIVELCDNPELLKSVIGVENLKERKLNVKGHPVQGSGLSSSGVPLRNTGKFDGKGIDLRGINIENESETEEDGGGSEERFEVDFEKCGDVFNRVVEEILRLIMNSFRRFVAKEEWSTVIAIRSVAPSASSATGHLRSDSKL